METKVKYPEALKQLRDGNEKGLDIVLVHEKQDIVLVILKCVAYELEYDCYRYFTIGDSWVISRDYQNVDNKTVFKWLVKFVEGM